jgi:hypothetical protein
MTNDSQTSTPQSSSSIGHPGEYMARNSLLLIFL